MSIRPHIRIHFEFGFTVGNLPPKSVRVGAPIPDLDERPPLPRKDTNRKDANRNTSSSRHHHVSSRTQAQQQGQQPRSQRPQVQVAIPNSSKPPHYLEHINAHAYHQHQHYHRSRRHHPRDQAYYQYHLDSRAARGRSAPPNLNEAYPSNHWVPAPQAPYSAIPGRRPGPTSDDVPQMHFRLGDAEMPWTPRPEFGEDEADNDSDVDEAFFAARRAAASRNNPRGESDMRLISRHSAPMVLSADSLAHDSDREPPPRHLTALQDALMTVDSGFGFDSKHRRNRASIALDLANVPSETFAQEFATSLAMWNQDQRVIMSTARERALAQQSFTPPTEEWSPDGSVGWAVARGSDDFVSPPGTLGPLASAGCNAGLVSPVSSVGGFPSGMPRRYSADTAISAA